MSEPETSPMDEAELVRRIGRRDRDAFAELVLRHQRQVRCFVAAYVRDAAAVDDIAQEVFLAAARKIGEFRHEASLATWLLGISRKQTLFHLRSQARKDLRRLGPLADDIERWRVADLEADELAPDRRRELEALQACLEKLAPESAKIVGDHYFRGVRVADIARALGRQENAVKVMLFRIRQSLRRCLDQALVGSAEGGLP
jgi:RNA polymerase sigma-70 factor (ECF subfamily)